MLEKVSLYIFFLFSTSSFIKAATLPTLPISNSLSLSSFYPPTVDGLSVAIEYDLTSRIDSWELYLLFVQAMNPIGHLPWDYPFAQSIRLGTPDNPLTLYATPSPAEEPSHLRVKHLIRGMYDMGFLMVSGPSYYRTLANLSVHDQELGKVRIERRASAVDANATVGSVQSRDLSILSNPQPAQRGDAFSIFDPEDRSFRIRGTFTGDNPPIEKLFTASLNVMAQAAIHGTLQKAAEPINAINFGDTRSSYALIGIIDNAEVFESSGQLRYGQVLQAIVCLWRMFRMGGKFGGLEAVIEFRGKEIGNVAVEGGSQVHAANTARVRRWPTTLSNMDVLHS